MAEPAPDLGSLPLFDDEPAHPAPPPPSVSRPPAWALAGRGAPHPLRPHVRPVRTDRPQPTAGTEGVGEPLLRSWTPPPRQPVPRSQTQQLSPAPGADTDWALVRALRQLASERLSTVLHDRPGLDAQERQSIGRRIVADLLVDHDDEAMEQGTAAFGDADRAMLAKATVDALFGLGRLQPLVDKPGVENIEILGYNNVWLQYTDGRLERAAPVADSNEELLEFLTFLASRSGDRPFSPANPTVHMTLDGGARLAASAWITPFPTVVIRLHRLRVVDLADLVGLGALDPNTASFLTAAVKAKKSIVISGPQGVGKTTFVRALCAYISPAESIGTAETEYELHLHEMTDRHPRCRAWEARPGSGERGPDGRPAGEIDLDRIIYDSFRFNLSRLIVGEVRGKEVTAMFKAMQGGAGSLSTTHAYSASAVIERLVTCAMESGPHVTAEFAYRQVAEHIDLIVQLALDEDLDGAHPYRRRYVSEVLAVEPGERGGRSGMPAVTPVYVPGQDGRARPGTLNEEMKALAQFGFDIAGFERGGRRAGEGQS